VRARRIAYDWGDFGRYTVWVANAPYFGWSVMTDYGSPGDECVVTSPHTEDKALEALQRYYQYDTPGMNFKVEEWVED
jgi:hypothetical protein